MMMACSGCEVPTELHRLACRGDWNGFMNRLDRFPEEASVAIAHSSWMRNEGVRVPIFVGVSGLVPFHIICANHTLPPEVVQRYVDIEPLACFLKTGNMRLAIHHAAFMRQSLEVLQLLARSSPDSLTQQDAFGWNVFHFFVRYGANDGVVDSLISVAGEERMRQALQACDRKGRTPILLACELKPRILKHDLGLLLMASHLEPTTACALLEWLWVQYETPFTAAMGSTQPEKPCLDLDPTIYCNPSKSVNTRGWWLWRPADSLLLWSGVDKALLILGANDENKSTHPSLHACLELDRSCKTETFGLLLRVNPHYACQLAPDGNLPLHVAARLATSTMGWVHRLSTLARLYPKAAESINGEGKLPIECLNIALMTRFHVLPILSANPTSLSRLQLPETLYPLILMQLGKAGQSGAIYSILRETPSLCQSG